MVEAVDIRRIFDSVSEIWVLVDHTGKVLLTSRHLEKFQYLLPSPVSEESSILDSVPQSWTPLAKDVLQTLQQSQVPSMVEASFTDRSGKEVHLEIKCTAVRGGDGDLQQVFIEAADVTPQKIFERKITIVAREYQKVIENANAVIIGIDVRGYITEWNEMASQVTGISKSEAYIQKLADFLLPDTRESFSGAMDAVLRGEMIANFEMVINARGQRALTILINVTPRTSATGETVGILLIGQDITELSAYRQSLEQQVKERTQALKSALENEKKLVEVKDRFVSMASHEFRSPISYIHRNIGTIRDNIEALSRDEVRQRLLKIQSQAEHLTSLLEDVLTMGKTGATNNRIKANLADVDLREFLHRIIDEVHSNTHHTHQIKFEFPADAWHIRSDENLLRNIFVNLLTNAIKFSPGRKTVELAVEINKHRVNCRIRDYGLGIAEGDLPRIFEPFHRGENVREIKGTGLGLPIVKKAVETLGGELAVESQAGTGTTFTVKLNLDES